MNVLVLLFTAKKFASILNINTFVHLEENLDGPLKGQGKYFHYTSLNKR